MKDSLLIFKLYRWSYDLKKMPNSWITLIIGFILLPIFIILRPLSMLPRLIPGYKKGSNSLEDLPVSIMFIAFLFGLTVTSINLITGADLFNNQELTRALIVYFLMVLIGIIFFISLYSVAFIIVYFNKIGGIKYIKTKIKRMFSKIKLPNTKINWK